MRRTAVTAAAITGVAAFAIGAAALTPNAAKKAKASSHREAPLISNDPTADLTDLYAFMSPGKTDTVTLMANVIPIEIPAEGPNYYNLDDTVRYRIMVDTNGDGKAEKRFVLKTHTSYAKGTFLYNTGPVTSLTSPNLAVKQVWNLSYGKDDKHQKIVARGRTAPNNVGKTSMPNYAALAQSAVKNAKIGSKSIKVFVGPREDPFAIDVGRIFDFLSVGGPGTDNLAGVNVHTIAIEVPASLLRKSDAQPVIGVWAATDRQVVKTVVRKRNGRNTKVRIKTWTQVERLGQPLVNEVLIPRTVEGLLEHAVARQGQAVREVLHGSGARSGPERPGVRPGARRSPRLRQRLPGRPDDGSCRPVGDPAPRLRLRPRRG